MTAAPPAEPRPLNHVRGWDQPQVAQEPRGVASQVPKV